MADHLVSKLKARTSVRCTLGLPEDRPWLDRLVEMFTSRPGAVVGCVSSNDAVFLVDLLEFVRPRRCVEIGTASGVSTGMLAMGMSLYGSTDAADPLVESFDCIDHFYADRSLPIGFAIPAICPELAPRIRMHTGCTSESAAVMFGDGQLEFVLIDANHSHPNPARDLLALLPALVSDAWVVLHDIELPTRYERHTARLGHPPAWKPEDGAKLLFDAWPFERLADEPTDGLAANIGVLRVPGDRRLVERALHSIIALDSKLAA